MMNTNAPIDGVLRLTATERARAGEALRELLVHGSILGQDPGKQELYAWCRAQKDVLRDLAELNGLDIEVDHENRLVLALPREAAMRLRLPMDTTLVLLALWYDYDTKVRNESATQVVVTIEELHQLLKEKLLPELKNQPTPTRMKDILRQASRFHLVRVTWLDPFETSRIEVLPTLRKVIPFTGIAEWTHLAELHRSAGSEEMHASMTEDPLESDQ